MALTTRYPAEIIIAETPENIIFGTAMLGETFGQVISATVSRDGDTTEIEKGGGQIMAFILSKMRFDFTFDVLFTAEAVPPDMAALITFPLAGIKGRVLPPIEIKWEQKGQRMLTIKATSWDAFSATNEGGGNASSYSAGTYTDLDA